MKFSGRLRSINEPRLIKLITPKLLFDAKTDIPVVFIFLSVILEKNVWKTLFFHDIVKY